MNRRNSKRVCCLGVLTSACIFTGVVLVAAAVTLMSVFPSILQQQVEERVPLQMGSPTFEQLQDPTTPIFKDVFFFNLTNPQQFEAGVKPELVEVGPYSYTETRTKTVMNISDDGELLTYNQTRVFHFNQDTTGQGLQENDTICTINIPLMAAVAQLQGVRGNILVDLFGGSVLRGIFSGANARLYVCQPATLLAWNYTDDLVQSLNRNIALRATQLNYPSTFINIQMNNSINDSFPSIIYTGVNNIEKIGKFVQWKGNLGSVDVWPNGMGANRINGTEGLVFHPFLSETEKLEVFSDDALRTVRLVHTDTLELMGIKVFRYEFDNTTFKSAFINPENIRWGSWNPDGLFFLGPTQVPVVPVFGSKPHFLDGDPILREKVNGLNPDRSLHESSLHVDPLTGANVQLDIKIQINAQVNQTSDYVQLENINGTLYFPILYINERSVLTSDFANYLLENGLGEAYLFMTLVPTAFGIMLAVAVVCFIVGLLSLIFCMRRIFCRSKLSGGDFQAEMSSSMNAVVLNGNAGASRGQTKEDNK